MGINEKNLFKNRLKIIVFLSLNLGDGRRQQFDSYNRLFGEPAKNPAPARKVVSSIPIGSDAPDSSLKQSNGNVNGRELNGHEKSNYHFFYYYFTF